MKNEMDHGNWIITVGLTGFPYSFAPSQKLLLMGKAAKEAGYEFLVVCNTFIKRTELNAQLTKSGVLDGIHYTSTSPVVFTPSSLLKKVVYKIKGIFQEFRLINRYRRQKKLSGIIVYSKSGPYSVFWGIYARLFRIKSCLIYFELVSSLKYRDSLFLKLNDQFFDKHIFRYFNGVITISESLIDQIKGRYPHKKYIKIPPLVNFEEFLQQKENEEGQKYFLYCGTLAYAEVIDFIIASYAGIRQQEEIKLFLVLNGDSSKLNQINDNIYQRGLTPYVQIFSGLEYSALIHLYVNAYALLIPLRNTPQDVARFPQKIAEYCAARRPIITTRFGEVKHYFEEDEVLFADQYDADAYGKKMEYALRHPEICKLMAEKAYEKGKLHFDYHSFAHPMKSFLNSL